MTYVHLPIEMLRSGIIQAKFDGPEGDGMVTLEVTRSGDLSLRSRVYYNTRLTSTDDAAATSKNSVGNNLVCKV